jgi:P-type conjugative transfer ATPase TrbB
LSRDVKTTVDPQLKDLAGPVWAHLIDDRVVEISLNDDGALFVERFGASATRVGEMAPERAERFIRYCANKGNVAYRADQTIISTRIVSMHHRLEAILPPNVAGASFSIRRHRDQVSDLSEFVPHAGFLAVIKQAIVDKENLLVSGGTGAGKTSFANACLAYLAQVAPEQRCVVLEDTAELQVPMPNTLKLISSENISMDRLLVSTLRLAPKRIIVGEVRTGKVMTLLLKAWNTGHPGGITTIHANSAIDVLPRVQMLCAEELQGGVDALIASSLDLIVHLSRGQEAPQVTQLARVTRCNDTFIIKEIEQ